MNYELVPVLPLYAFKAWTLTTLLYAVNRGRNIVVGVDIRLRDRPSGVRIPAGTRYFAFSETSRPALGPTQSIIQWV
jgi:hypothetical protein